MIKRILSTALAVLTLLTVLPMQTMATGSYTVSVLQDKTVSKGSDVIIKLDLSKSQASTYNAFDVTISYDKDILEYKSCTLPTNQVKRPEADTIQLQGYGDGKSKTTALAELTFTAKAAGTANVQLDSAKIDRSGNAINHNAPQAAYDKKSATITVQPTYKVTLPEGFSPENGKLEAIKGQGYTFQASDYANYTYEITAKAGGKEVDVTDHKNGKYTIPASGVTGDIVVTAKKTPKSYDVSFTGQNITGEKTATYNTPYTFKLDRQTGYNYTVKVTIGGQAYSKYTLKDDLYTIPGTDITGKIAVTVTKTKKTTTTATGTRTTTTSKKTSTVSPAGSLKVEISGSGYSDTTGSPYIKKGTTYGFRIKKEEGYAYDISVQIDGKTVDYTYDEERDLYQIPGTMITGNVTIVVTKKVNVMISEYITLDGQSIYLLLVPGDLKKNEIPKFDGQSMYRSDIYPGYTWLIQSADNQEKITKLAEELIGIAEGKTEVSADYSGNVNLSGEIDINDAQLVFDMYSAKYKQPDMSSIEFLSADVNGDQRVNVLDVEWILYHIRSMEQGGLG